LAPSFEVGSTASYDATISFIYIADSSVAHVDSGPVTKEVGLWNVTTGKRLFAAPECSGSPSFRAPYKPNSKHVNIFKRMSL